MNQPRRRRDPGIALVLVMTVVLALVVVATPFVLSMILQERSGTTARYESQADYGAEGAKNYAMWRLMLSVDPVERRSGTGVFSSYYFDTAQEFDIRLDDQYLQRIRISDPTGSIWGVGPQDENGKMNLRSAPNEAIARVQSMVDNRVVPHKDYLTLYSGRDASWVYPQRIRPQGYAQGQPSGGITADVLHVLGPRAKVRASKPGAPPLVTEITGNAVLGSSGTDGFTTRESVAGYVDGVIEVEERHRINLNTARRETLVAMFEGLSLYNIPNSTVDRGSAVQLANALAGRQVRRLEEFVLILLPLGLQTQQKAAVLLNAVCPTAALLQGTGTVGICFKSYDVYTLEAFASMNNPAGVQVGGRGFREVVSVSPPSLLTRACESQLDFDLMLALGADVTASLAGLGGGPQFLASGYPYGSRMVSFPRMLPPPGAATEPGQPYGPSDVALKNQQRGPNEAFVMPRHARDMRGESDRQYEQALQNWPNNEPRDHFDGALEGRRLQGGQAHTYPWGQVIVQDPPPNQNPPPGQTRPDHAAGGIELEVRFDTIANPTQIFDIREQDYTNRMTLRVENGELIFTVSDATIGTPVDPIDNGAAEIRQPFVPEKDTWYHFGAYWKGTKYANLALLVNGFAHPQQKFSHVTGDPGNRKILTKITGQMDTTTTSIALQDDSFLPSTLTPLQVGSEVMLYDKAAGVLLRGARGTVAQTHPAQAAVSIFGYSSKLRTGQVTVPGSQYPPCPYDRLTMGGATLQYNIGQNPMAQVAGDKVDPNTGNRYIDASQTDIGVTTPAVMDFPDQGYITIQQEVIFYTGRSTGGVGGQGNAKFTGCQRGLHGTTAVQHNNGQQVRMWGIPVTNHTNYLTPTIIAIGDEFFGPVQKDPTKANFWISFVNGGQPLALQRGNSVFASIQQAHSAGEQVMPTFLCRDADPQGGGGLFNAGRYDRVTITDAQNNKEQQRVRISGPPPPPPPGQPQIWPGNYQVQAGGGNEQIVSFDANVIRDYVADDFHVRILKFPSGELLGLNWLTTANPQFSIGPMDAMIDEVKFFVTPKRPIFMGGQADANANTLTLGQGGGLAQRGGLLKVGDEYVGYGQAGGTAVSQLKRGWLNSTAEVHDQGDRVFYLYWVPVSTLQSDITATDNFLQLNQRMAGRPGGRRGWRMGYVLVENELIGFEAMGQNGQVLVVPPRWDGQSGLYRGMFGTAPASHTAATSLVYGLPHRYWDTFKAREFDNTMVYFQWSTKMELARWINLSWIQEVPANDPNIVVHALVRIDGKGEFWDPPGLTDRTLVLEFLTPGAAQKIGRVGYEGDPGQLDVRFYVEYKQGAFDAAAPWNALSWRRAPKIKKLEVEYDRPSQTLYHEDR